MTKTKEKKTPSKTENSRDAHNRSSNQPASDPDRSKMDFAVIYRTERGLHPYTVYSLACYTSGYSCITAACDHSLPQRRVVGMSSSIKNRVCINNYQVSLSFHGKEVLFGHITVRRQNKWLLWAYLYPRRNEGRTHHTRPTQYF